MTKVVCIMGTTCSGKSQLALELARNFPCEIISVDSAQIYRGMDIGTAKPSPAILKEIPHHLIDIRDPSETYSAAEFRKEALPLMAEIAARGKIPLLVGGTMLYFRALQVGLSDLPSADSGLRQKITEEAHKIGWEKMHEHLQKVDPIAAQRIHPNDTQRIQRALEVFEMTGTPISQMQTLDDQMPCNYLNFALGQIDRKILHRKIEDRFDEMLSQGLVAEVQRLFERGDLSMDMPSMRTVGYRQIWQYLSGQLDFQTMREKAIAATRQLAKRQLTWLKSWPNLCWIDGRSLEFVNRLIRLSAD